MKQKKNKGISLIVLIIMIVVIIILATTIIVNLLDSNIIGNANDAVFKQNIVTIKDNLNNYIMDKYTKSLGEYEAKNLKANKNGIWYGNKQEEGTIEDIIGKVEEKILNVIFIDEGELYVDVLNITAEEKRIYEQLGIIAKVSDNVDLGKIDIVASEKEWTKEDIEIEIRYDKEISTGYVIEFRVGGESWEEYKEKIKENNTVVIARIYSKEKDNELITNTYEISNIDKEEPSKPTDINIEEGVNSVTATATGSIDSLSGIEKYQYSLDNSTWQDSGTFRGIKSGTDMTVYARAVDKVGNVSESISDSGTTSSIEQVQIEQNPVSTNSTGGINWTNEDVTVTLGYNNIPNGYVLQYRLGSDKWTDYKEAITISDNNTSVVARIYNATLDDEGNSVNSRTISNIDKTGPTVSIDVISGNTTEWTNKDITLRGVSSDTQSGVVTYQFSTNSGLTANSDGWKTTTVSPPQYGSVSVEYYTVSSNGIYYYYAKDAVGNVSSKSIEISNIDNEPPVLDLDVKCVSSVPGKSKYYEVKIISDVENKYNNYEPRAAERDDNNKSISLYKVQPEDVSKTEPGPIKEAKTWKFTKTGKTKQWNGWEGNYDGIFTCNSGDYIMISGYYKTTSACDAGFQIVDYMATSDWSSYYDISVIETNVSKDVSKIIKDGNWHYFYTISQVNENISNAIADVPSWNYSKTEQEMYINGLSWKIIPSDKKTALDIHKLKYAYGYHDVKYFQDGGGNYIYGNKIDISNTSKNPERYTIYAEDQVGNGIVKKIDLPGFDD